MKTIDFTKEQELLVPPPSDPYDAFRLLIDDDLLDLIVRETNGNANMEMVQTTSKRGSVVLKPSAIVHYNNFMSGKDLQDQMLACSKERRCWYKKLFVHMLLMKISNSLYL
ncbi:unnamed protein product [Pieris brassicae]|uniref:PiggyBac transposable element-derived protein domain-containing protein n=1 Tax=Pieris brassicae TaxID=7116 RepID=A0A9P0TWK8_PIEBR|nr:unnamed protein product [Pieris brassicae]